MRTKSKRVAALVGAALLVIGLAGPVEEANAAPPAPPELTSLTATDADAGWFRAVGVCPAKTAYISYRWTNAPNGQGWGQAAIRSGPFDIGLRMQASAVGQTIDATIKCMRASGRTNAAFAPVTLQSGNALLAAPPSDSGEGRRIVYSLGAQQLWAFEADGTIVKTHLVSGRRLSIGGRKSQLGTFKVWRKRIKGGCRGGCPYFLGFHLGWTGDEVIGFHQIPFTKRGPYQTESELGQPRSHGCVRQAIPDAIWMFEWTQMNDKVVVIP